MPRQDNGTATAEILKAIKARAGRLQGRFGSWRPLRHAARTALAAFAAHLIATGFSLPQPFWAVITAIVVVQASVGASLGVAMAQVLGALLGAAIGAMFYVAGSHLRWPMAAIMAATVLVLAYVGALRPGWRLAPISAVIVMLATASHVDPFVSAATRIGEVALGAVVALIVSLAVFPDRAGRALAAQLRRILPLLDAHFAAIIARATGRGGDGTGMTRLYRDLDLALSAGDIIAAEARREAVSLADAHGDPKAPLRALRRLLVTQIAAAQSLAIPLPPVLAERLTPAFDAMGVAVGNHYHALHRALAGAGPFPELTAVDTALARLVGMVSTLRRDGLLRTQPDDVVASLYALEFALRQMVPNLRDLGVHCQELWNGSGGQPSARFASPP